MSDISKNSVTGTDWYQFNFPNGDGIYKVYTYAQDNAGNLITKTPNNGSNWYYQAYKIDSTAPTISFDVANGSSFTAPKTVTITFADNLAGVKERYVSVIKSDGTTLLSNYAAPNNTYSYTFTDVGTYTIYANAVDNAGNNYYTAHNTSAMVTVTITAACTRQSSCGCESYNAWKNAGGADGRKCGPGNKTGATYKYSSCIYQGNGCHGTNAYYCIYQTRTCAQYKCC